MGVFNPIFSNEILKYMKLQCNEVQSLYSDPPEIKVVKKYFENVSPKNVLELGCGLGRVSVAFYKAFSLWAKTNFYLLDGDSGTEQIAGINYDSNKSFYNSLKLTEEFCLINGVPRNQIVLINAEQIGPFPFTKSIKFDFVYSFFAIGFHWPIDIYLERLSPYLNFGSILCFGIRPNIYAQDQCEKFNTYQLNSVPRNLFEVLELTTDKLYSSKLILRKI